MIYAEKMGSGKERLYLALNCEDDPVLFMGAVLRQQPAFLPSQGSKRDPESKSEAARSLGPNVELATVELLSTLETRCCRKVRIAVREFCRGEAAYDNLQRLFRL